jgi:hypothetical protein
MEKSQIISNLSEKYKEIFAQYFELFYDCKVNKANAEKRKGLDFLRLNLNYIEKYIDFLKIQNKPEMEKELFRINCIKEIYDILYNPSIDKPLNTNPKIEEVK